MDSKKANTEKTGSVPDLQTFNSSSTVKLTEINSTIDMSHGGESYDPFKNREQTHLNSDLGALIHLFKASLSSGILAVPKAFKHGGLVTGIIGTILVGALCTHCVAILVRCSRILSVRMKKPSLTFAETAEAAFTTGPSSTKKMAPIFREFVTLALFCTYYFGSTVYLLFISMSFKQVIDHHLNIDLNIRCYLVLLMIPLLPLSIWRQLTFLVPITATGSLFILLGLVATFFYAVQDMPPMSTRNIVFDSIDGLPLFFSTVVFAMEGIGTVLPIENSMKNPEHFLGPFGVLNIAMALVVILFATVGSVGYMKWGNDIQNSVTFNLPDDSFSELVKILVALSLLFTYGLQFCVPSEIVWNHLKHRVNLQYENVCYYTMRGIMIVGTVCFAILVPDLAPFIGLIGSICFSLLGLWIPAFIEIITYWEERVSIWLYVKNAIIMMVAVITLVTGGYTSILEIISLYQQESKS